MSRQNKLPDWDAMRVFLMVARHSSFRSAREELNMSQSTAMRRIRDLEHTIGHRVFLRNRDGVLLTNEGQKLLPIAEDMERLSLSVGGSLRKVDKTLAGKVRLWLSDGIGGYWLPWLLRDFHENYPEICLEVLCKKVNVFADLTKMDADITVVYKYPDNPDVCVLASSTMDFKLCAAKSYVARHGKPETLDDLRDHRMCVHEMDLVESGSGWEDFTRIMKDHKMITYITDSALALCFATKYGVGISMQPVAVPEREHETMHIDIPGFAPSVPFWLVCHKHIKDDPKVRLMVEYLKKNIFAAQKVPGSMTRRIDGDPVLVTSPGFMSSAQDH